ncbi:MAG: cupredoxin domain-containing protein [Thermoplasmatota archaeon]
MDLRILRIGIIVSLLAAFTVGVFASAAPGTDGQVTVSNFQFTDRSSQTPITSIGSGHSVTFTWVSGCHTVTSDNGALQSFDSGTNCSGATFVVTFSAAGAYAYHCAIHAEMHGVIVVT